MGRIVLAILLGCTLMAKGQQQDSTVKRITINLPGITLEKALSILSIGYNVDLTYSDDIIPGQSPVDLSVKDETILSALEKLLTPFGITFRVVNEHRIVLRKIPAALSHTIRGVIMDAVTGVTIPGASVIIEGSMPMIGGTTDEHGRFELRNVPVGRRSVTVRSIGYNPKTIPNILLTSGKEIFLSATLEESITTMDEVIVSGIRNDGIPGEGAAVISSRSFTVEESKRYAGSIGDHARMAGALPGVTPASDETNALIVRGNSPRGVLWRLEGIEIPNPNHFATEGASSGVVSLLSPNVVDGSDLLTSAFPAQYGNALSAVLDIHLRKGNSKRKEYSFQAGALGMEASAEGPFHKSVPASYLVNYRYSALSVLNNLGVRFNALAQYKDYQDLAFNLHWRTGGGELSLFGIGGKSEANRSDTILFDNNESAMGVIGLAYRRHLDENTSLHSVVSLSGTRIFRYREFNGLEGGLLALREEYVKSYARGSLTLRRRITNRYYVETGAIFTRLGYDFFLRNIDIDNAAYQVILNFSEEEHDATATAQAFVYARQYLSPSITAFYGFHYLGFALTGDRALEPRAGLRWVISDDLSMSLGYGKHSRIENLQFYLARNHQPGGNEVQINRNLGFTRAHHLSLAVEQVFRSTHKAKVESYYQRLYNAPVSADPTSIYASINEDTGFIADTLLNKGKGKNYGIEISFERRFLTNWYYMTNGSLYQSRFSVRDEPAQNSAYNAGYNFHFLVGKEYPSHQDRNRFGLNIRLSMAGGRHYVPIDLERSIAERRQVYDWDAAFTKRLPGYFRTDAQLVYRMNRSHHAIELRLDIQNVTSHRNVAYFFYDISSEQIRIKRQVGLLPILSCRVDF